MTQWWRSEELERWKRFGPMHGERTHRWQRLVEGNSKKIPAEPTIVTIYTLLPEGTPRREPLLYVELMLDGHITQARFTVESAQGLADAATEFVRAWHG